jgi:hypothetical protein
MRVGDEELTRDHVLIIEPGAEVPEFEVGSEGVHLLECAKTTAGTTTIFAAADRDNPAYRDGLAVITDAAFECLRARALERIRRSRRNAAPESVR